MASWTLKKSMNLKKNLCKDKMNNHPFAGCSEKSWNGSNQQKEHQRILFEIAGVKCDTFSINLLLSRELSFSYLNVVTRYWLGFLPASRDTVHQQRDKVITDCVSYANVME